MTSRFNVLFHVLKEVSSHKFALYWAIGAWLLDVILTGLIIYRVPFTNIDWETYMVQVGLVLEGQYDYAKISGPTGPIAYPAGFCWLYATLRALNLRIKTVQLLFGALYLCTTAVVLMIYKRAGVPGWLMVLPILSKRVHSIFVLRLFNDGVAQCLFFLAVLLLLQKRWTSGSVAYSLAVSVKMQPLLCCPAIGLVMVLSRGWQETLFQILLMVVVQLGLAAVFLAANPRAYLQRAFGGPGDLQHVWSVNWKMLPQSVFLQKYFAFALQAIHLSLLAAFAQAQWVTWLVGNSQGLVDGRLWKRRALSPLGDTDVVAVCFACTFVGVCCLRTLHFHYLVWYYHMVPFLAWYALQPDRHRGVAWACRCVAIVSITALLELPYLMTQPGIARGPDGREWRTQGTASSKGSCLLQVAHVTLLLLLAVTSRALEDKEVQKQKAV